MGLHVPIFVLTVVVVVEVAVLVPVIVMQREHDIIEQNNKLGFVTDQFVGALNNTVNEFIYSVLRTSGSASIVQGLVTQKDMETSLVLNKNPTTTPDLLYVWVPLVADANRTVFENFYGYPITELNGTNKIVNATRRAVYAPLCLFVPKPNATTAFGFDLLSTPITNVLLRNLSLYMYPHATLLQRSPNSFGLLVVSLDDKRKGYMIGRVGAEDLLAFSLQVPRSQVTLCAFDASVVPAQQLLFCDNVPRLQNVSSVATFNAIPSSNEFFVRSLNVLGDDLLIFVRYGDAYASTYMPSTWIILVAVLVPVCCCIDLVIVGLSLLWRNRLELQRLEREKREAAQIMLGYVNHEIRNPLQAILGLSELCLEELADMANERVISNLETVIRSAEFIQHIAKDILDVRRIEEGKIALEISNVDIWLLISGLEKAIQSLLKERIDVEFFVDVTQMKCGFLETDRYRLEQILMNFLTNAVKHTERGTITLKFELTSDFKRARISVADTGRGIPEDKKEKLFAQFSQVDVRDATTFGGFGLGLYLSKMLATLLGGTIGFESQLGEGSVFWLELPLKSSQMPLDVEFEQSATFV